MRPISSLTTTTPEAFPIIKFPNRYMVKHPGLITASLYTHVDPSREPFNTTKLIFLSYYTILHDFTSYYVFTLYATSQLDVVQQLLEMAASLGSLQVVVAADMLTGDVDVGDGGLAGQLAQRVLDVRAVIHLVQLEQQGLVLRQVHLLEERLLGALAVGAVRLGGDEDGLGLDEGLNTGDSLSRDHCEGGCCRVVVTSPGQKCGTGHNAWTPLYTVANRGCRPKRRAHY